MAEPWKLYYWGPDVTGCGRAEFVRLLLEETGQAYEEVNDKSILKALFWGGKWTGFPALAPPVIQKGDFSLSQTGVICRYLGKHFGLYPESEVDEWHAEQVNATVVDYISEGRLAFHGINHSASYFTQKEETKPYIERFVAERIPRFLKHFEDVLRANNGGDGFLFGKKITYIDLVLLHALRATASQFPEAWQRQSKDIPLLAAFKDRMETRPRLVSYFKSERCKPFEGNSMM